MLLDLLFNESAALLRCQGVNVKGLLKTALAKEELNRTLMLLEICRCCMYCPSLSIYLGVDFVF